MFLLLPSGIAPTFLSTSHQYRTSCCHAKTTATPTLSRSRALFQRNQQVMTLPHCIATKAGSNSARNKISSRPRFPGLTTPHPGLSYTLAIWSRTYPLCLSSIYCPPRMRSVDLGIKISHPAPVPGSVRRGQTGLDPCCCGRVVKIHAFGDMHLSHGDDLSNKVLPIEASILP